MSFHHGNAGIVKIAAAIVAEVQEWTYNEADVAVREKTSMGDTEAEYVASGTKRGEGSVNCLLDPSDSSGQEAMTAGATVALKLYNDGDQSNDWEWAGNAIVETINIVVNKENIEERNFTFKGVLAKTQVV